MCLVTGSFHRRLRIFLVTALCAVFAAGVGSAQVVALEGHHCGQNMPCCPSSGPLDGSSQPSCNALVHDHSLSVTTANKTIQLHPAPVPPRAVSLAAGSPLPASVSRPLHRPPVFQLKDDLRI